MIFNINKSAICEAGLKPRPLTYVCEKLCFKAILMHSEHAVNDSEPQ